MMRWLAASMTALALSGCAGLEKQPAPAAARDDLYLHGRLALQVAADGARKATSANLSFELTGHPAAGRLELSTSLGSLMARATWRAEGAWIETPEGGRQFDNLDALTRELLGEPIPVAALFDWLRGQPWPQMPHAPQAQGFEQLGWRIDTARVAEGLITATRQREPAVTLRARIEK